MQESAFRAYLRRFVTSQSTNQPLTADTIKRYVGDMVLIERRMKEKGIGNGLDRTSLPILNILIETRMSDIVGTMEGDSIDNYQTSARHYLNFLRYNNQ